MLLSRCVLERKMGDENKWAECNIIFVFTATLTVLLGVCMCLFVCVCVCACVRACMRACVHSGVLRSD